MSEPIPSHSGRIALIDRQMDAVRGAAHAGDIESIYDNIRDSLTAVKSATLRDQVLSLLDAAWHMANVNSTHRPERVGTEFSEALMRLKDYLEANDISE